MHKGQETYLHCEQRTCIRTFGDRGLLTQYEFFDRDLRENVSRLIHSKLINHIKARALGMLPCKRLHKMERRLIVEDLL